MITLHEIKHFTATVFLFDEENRVLLIKHPKIGKWLPPGGHMEPNELPIETAIREVEEEVGIKISFETENLKDAIAIPVPEFLLESHTRNLSSRRQ